MAFAGGQRMFDCSLPGTTKTADSEQNTSVLSNSSKHTAYLRDAKMAPLRKKCWKMKKDYWSYEICFNSKLLQYRPDTETRFSLGEHQAELDEMLPDGSLTQYYSGGSDNRSTQLKLVCGKYSEKRLTIEEPTPLKYIMEVTGPTFCSWRDRNGLETQDGQNNKLVLSSLLEELRGQCLNVTQGWWTYEYCFPHTMRQYHLQPGGKKPDPEHLLGTLNKSSATQRPDEVEVKMVGAKKTSDTGDKRRAVSNHKVLQQIVGDGTVCDETLKARTTTLNFECPHNWQSTASVSRIASITETALCKYDVLIHTNLVCAHRKLLPALPKGKEAIKCVARPKAKG
eukprot:gnl/MRDRNA2_/MRDRNA2_250630_c0_seq1.p1 gnl/MRDRNA2_/MRDRNA2_250630_c0~~gnl/MRDRNA2_/MRDRNA2_250630_c0_seq1.p1  ORF type:complete len:400 (+),score=62.97 gnl/MRDRNA2_/MRDRNA2_250630_c0_seq1:181-1200(+)